MGLGAGMAIPTIPRLATTFEIVPGLAAQIVTAQLLGRVLSLLPGGIIVDRLGTRPAMLMGSGMVAVGAFGTAVGPTFVSLLVAQLVAGGGTSIWQLGREIAAVDMVQKHQRGRALSGFFGLSSAGSVFGPVLGGIVADRADFRAVFWIYLALALVVLVAALPMRGRRAHVAAAASPVLSLAAFRSIAPVYRATFVVLIIATFAAMLRQSSINSLLPLHVGSVLGYSTTELGGLFGIMGVFSIVMIAPVGFLSDRVGRKAAALPAAALSAVVFIGFPFARELWQLSALSALAGIANGFALGAMTTYTYDIAPRESRGKLQAFRRASGELGGLVGPSLGGFIATIATPGVAFLVFSPLHIVSAALLLFVARETLGRTTRDIDP